MEVWELCLFLHPSAGGKTEEGNVFSTPLQLETLSFFTNSLALSMGRDCGALEGLRVMIRRPVGRLRRLSKTRRVESGRPRENRNVMGRVGSGVARLSKSHGSGGSCTFLCLLNHAS